MDEQLKEIQELEGYGGLGGYAVYFKNKKQFEWLKEQASKVQELESNNVKLSYEIVKRTQLLSFADKEIQIHKEALEFYASRTEWIDGDIYLDGGEKARQALERR